jgi:threonine/homoserine/homoserine lactone efflux protein
MGEVMEDLLPSALGVALSPVPVVAMILMLGSPRARPRGTAFALGWVLGLAVVTVVVVVPSGDGGDGDGLGSLGPGPETVVGALLVVLAAWQWRTRPRAGGTSLPAQWMTLVDGLGAARCGVLGAALCCINPKNLALTVAAGSSIARGEQGGIGTVVLASLFVVLGSLTVAGPLIWHAVAPDRAARSLTVVRDVMATYGAAIVATVLLLLGARLLGAGISGLAG